MCPSQGGAGGLSEALLENALVESLGTDPTAAGYDVAKDYLKQVRSRCILACPV